MVLDGLDKLGVCLGVSASAEVVSAFKGGKGGRLNLKEATQFPALESAGGVILDEAVEGNGRVEVGHR
jgi:hypothetical protein